MRNKLGRTHGALIVARFSTDNQDGVTIDVQVDECRRWCASHGLPVLGVYADYAVSGMKSSRPQFDAMLSALRSGQADTVVFYDQSRLIRGFLDWFAFRRELDRLEVQVVSVTQDFVGGDLMDNAVLIQETFTAIHNQMFVSETRKRVKSALRYRAQSGQHTGGKPPLGYDLVDKHLVVNEAEAAVVRRIFTEYSSGKSYHDIIIALNADGVKTKSGKTFGSNSLHDLMKNRRYIGEFVFGGKAYDNHGHRIRGVIPADAVTVQHPELAIVDIELFNAVQQRMALNRRTSAGRHGVVRDYPLKGKVFCGQCGSAMTIQATTVKGKRYIYYECAAKKRTHECTIRKIRVDELEEKVITYVRSIIGNPDIIGKVRELVQDEANAIIQGGMEKARSLANELNSVEAKISNLLDVLANVGHSEALAEKLRTLESEKAELRRQLTALRNAAEVSAAPAALLDELVSAVVDNYSEAALFSIVTRVDVFSDKIRIFTSFDPKTPPHTPDDDTFIKIDGTSSGVPKNRAA